MSDTRPRPRVWTVYEAKVYDSLRWVAQEAKAAVMSSHPLPQGSRLREALASLDRHFNGPDEGNLNLPEMRAALDEELPIIDENTTLGELPEILRGAGMRIETVRTDREGGTFLVTLRVHPAHAPDERVHRAQGRGKGLHDAINDAIAYWRTWQAAWRERESRAAK